MYAKAILGLIGVAVAAVIIVPSIFSVFSGIGEILRSISGS